jgi:hypothetical protein
MDELIKNLSAKVGIDQATATKVAAFINDHKDEIPKWLASEQGKSVLDKVPGGDKLGGMLGGLGK